MAAPRQRKAKDDQERASGARTTGRPSAATPAAAGPHGVLDLQRAVGNRAVVRAVVQRSLQVGPAGDRFEQEADRIADDVMRALAGPPVGDRGAARVSRSAVDGAVGLEGGPLGADTETAITRARGGGRPLPDALRSSMEGSFGADFGAVRVHSGPSADELNRSMQARAFTVGADIFFARGQYQPGSSSGKRLLAHELAHTVQQGGAPPTGSEL